MKSIQKKSQSRVLQSSVRVKEKSPFAIPTKAKSNAVKHVTFISSNKQWNHGIRDAAPSPKGAATYCYMTKNKKVLLDTSWMLKK